MITPSTNNDNLKIRFTQSPNRARLELAIGGATGTLGFILLYVAWSSGVLRIVAVLIIFVGGTFYSVSTIRRFPAAIQDDIARQQRSYFLLLLAAAASQAYDQMVRKKQR
jgi:hypothetical protein